MYNLTSKPSGMDAKIWKGTLIGGVVYFILGWIIYGMLLAGYLASNFNNCANRSQEDMIWWAIIASNLIYALFLTLILKWSGTTTIVGGLKTGALFGLLMTSTFDLSMYSMTTTFQNFTGLIVDVVIATALAAFIGMVIVLLWGKEKTA